MAKRETIHIIDKKGGRALASGNSKTLNEIEDALYAKGFRYNHDIQAWDQGHYRQET